MKRCDLDMIHRGTIYEGHAIFTKQLFLSLFNVATHPIPKVQDPSKQKTIQHVTSTSPCMRSWWAEGSRQHIAPSGRRWEEGSRHGASIDHRVPGARAVRGTPARAPPQGGWRWGGPLQGRMRRCGGRTMVQPGVRRPGRDRGRVLVGSQW